MKDQVQLPNEQLIDYWSFCKAIAEGICPADEKDWKGIDCIVGKQITVRVASAVPSCQENKQSLAEVQQRVVNESSVSDRSHPDLRDVIEASINYPASDVMSDQPVGDFPVQYKLKEEDREMMEKLLPALPALHYPLSEKDAAEFMDAYSVLLKRPAWEPLLITTAYVEQQKENQYELVCRHQKALLKELEFGRLVAVTADHVRVKTFSPGVFIPRKEAIAYLDRSGIPYDDLSFNIKASEKKPRVIGKPMFSAQQKKEIAKFHQSLKDKNDPKPTAKTMERFKISDATVKNYVREAKQAAEVVKSALSSRVVKHR